MTAPVNKFVSINGIDVSSYVITFSQDEEWGGVVGQFSLVVAKSIANVIDLTLEKPFYPIIVKRGPVTGEEVTIFQGKLVDHVEMNGRISLYCQDKYIDARHKIANTSFDKNIDSEAGVLSEIYLTLFDTYTDITVDSTSIQNSGSALVVDKFVCNNTKVYERGNDIAVYLDWQHYYDSRTDKGYLEPKGYVDETTVLTVGDNVVKALDWSYVKVKMFNIITIIGAEQDAQTSEFFDGDASETEFQLQFTPTSVKVFVGSSNFDPYGTGTKPSDDPNNLEVGGKIGSTSGTYDYEYDEDPKVKHVKFQDTSIPSNNTKNIEVQYTYKLPTPVKIKDLSSIETYEVEIEHVVTKEDIKTVADAEVFGRGQLAKYSVPFVSTQLLVIGEQDIRVGRTYRVVDVNKGIDRYLIVTKIKRQFPYKPDEITVGDEILKTNDWGVITNDRIKRLEEKEGKTTDLLVQVLEFNREVQYRRRYAQINSIDMTDEPDIMVYGNETYGTWNEFKWGVRAKVETVQQIIQGNNDYREYFMDDVFIDTVTSTATLNTTNNDME